MKILIDADGCPVTKIACEQAEKYNIECKIICDTSHIFQINGAETITVSKGADSVDFHLVNLIEKGDIVITQDYGLASLLLAKKATVLHHNGFFYTQENIDRMLFERHLSREMRRQKKSRGGHVRKRTKEDDEKFLSALEKAIQKNKTASL